VTAIDEVYCETFTAFNAYWVECNPPDIMSFAPIFKKFKDMTRSKYPTIRDAV
jgi:hypothetical protein